MKKKTIKKKIVKKPVKKVVKRVKKAVKKEKPKRKKIRRLVKKVLKNVKTGTEKTKGQILKEEGYAESTQKEPKRVFNTRSFRDILNEEMAKDEGLDPLKMVKDLSGASSLESMVFPDKMTDEEIEEKITEAGYEYLSTKRFMLQAYAYFLVPNTVARNQVLDKILKVRGDYNDTHQVEFTEKTQEAFDKLANFLSN